MPQAFQQVAVTSAEAVPHVPAFFSAFLRADPWAGQLAASLGADEAMVAKFKSLMQAQAMPVDTERLFLDSQYAYQRFALAHSCADEQLRHLVMVLFEGYLRLEARRQNWCLGCLGTEPVQ